jgi:hypothetical protein
MFNLIVVATGLFMGQYTDKASCQSAIRAIYFQQMAGPRPELLTKSALKEIGKAIEINMQWQKEYICIPAKRT